MRAKVLKFVFDTTALKASVAQAQSALEQAKSRLSVSDLEALASKRNAQSSQQSILSLRDQVAAAKAKLDKSQYPSEQLHLRYFFGFG